jgi:hypothetical protein
VEELDLPALEPGHLEPGDRVRRGRAAWSCFSRPRRR